MQQKKEVWKMIFLFNWVTFRFHVNFREGSLFYWSSNSVVSLFHWKFHSMVVRLRSLLLSYFILPLMEEIMRNPWWRKSCEILHPSIGIHVLSMFIPQFTGFHRSWILSPDQLTPLGLSVIFPQCSNQYAPYSSILCIVYTHVLKYHYMTCAYFLPAHRKDELYRISVKYCFSLCLWISLIVTYTGFYL